MQALPLIAARVRPPALDREPTRVRLIGHGRRQLRVAVRASCCGRRSAAVRSSSRTRRRSPRSRPGWSFTVAAAWMAASRREAVRVRRAGLLRTDHDPRSDLLDREPDRAALPGCCWPRCPRRRWVAEIRAPAWSYRHCWRRSTSPSSPRSGASSSGGFSSLSDVATLFGNPWLLLAGWTHYLAFDLFVGSWEVRDARGSRDAAPAGAALPRPDVSLRSGRMAALPGHPFGPSPRLGRQQFSVPRRSGWEQHRTQRKSVCGDAQGSCPQAISDPCYRDAQVERNEGSAIFAFSAVIVEVGTLKRL